MLLDILQFLFGNYALCSSMAFGCQEIKDYLLINTDIARYSHRSYSNILLVNKILNPSRLRFDIFEHVHIMSSCIIFFFIIFSF